MYDRTSSETDINVARKVMFAHKGRAMNAIPPTKGALMQHCKRVVYQAGYIWCQSLIPSPSLPSPSHWGWMKTSESKWKPLWTDMVEATFGAQNIVKCGCKKGCTGKCKCKMLELSCISLCTCRGNCSG